MCIYLSLLLFYQFLGVFTFHDSAKSRFVHSLWLSSFLPMFRCSIWSEQCQALVIFSRLACLPLLSTGSCRAKISFCFTRVYKLRIFLVSVDSETVRPPTQKEPRQGQNQVRRQGQNQLRRQGQNWVHRQGQNQVCRQGQSANSTPQWGSSHTVLTPLTQHWHHSHAVLTPLSRCNDAAPAPGWRPSDAAMPPLPRHADASLTFIQPVNVYTARNGVCNGGVKNALRAW